MRTKNRFDARIAGLLLVLSATALPAGAAIETAGTVYVDLDATNLAALADGEMVMSWTNHGTGGIANFTPAFGGAAPVYYATAYGVPAVAFLTSYLNTAGTLAPADVTGNSDWSAEFWAYNPDLQDDEALMCWASRQPAGGHSAQLNFGSSAGYGAVSHWNADLGYGPAGSPAPAAWHHVVMTYDGLVERVYVDGRLANEGDRSFLNIQGGHEFLLGGAFLDPSDTAGDIPFSGALAQVRLMGGVLSPAQVVRNYRNDNTGFGQGAAADSLWTNSAATGDWATAENWDGGVPGGNGAHLFNGRTAVLSSAAPAVSTLAVDYTNSTVRIDTGGDLTAGQVLLAQGAGLLVNGGALTDTGPLLALGGASAGVSGGVLRVAGNLEFQGTSGALTVDDGGVCTLAGQRIFGGTTVVNAGGTLNFGASDDSSWGRVGNNGPLTRFIINGGTVNAEYTEGDGLVLGDYFAVTHFTMTPGSRLNMAGRRLNVGWWNGGICFATNLGGAIRFDRATGGLWIGAGHDDPANAAQGYLVLGSGASVDKIVGAADTNDWGDFVVGTRWGGSADNNYGRLNMEPGSSITWQRGAFMVGRDAASTGVATNNGGTISIPNAFLAIGQWGGNGTLVMNGGTLDHGREDFYVADAGGAVGLLVVNSATVRHTANWRFAIGNNNATGTMIVRGASSVVDTGPNEFQVGNYNGGMGTLILDDGTINTHSWTVTARDGAGNGHIVINGGRMNILGDGNGGYLQVVAGCGRPGQTGTWDINGGVLNAAAGSGNIEFSAWYDDNNYETFATVNLNGGRLIAGEIWGGNTGPEKHNVFNFNGGVLQLNASRTLLHDLESANVGAGGAILDLAGYDTTIRQPLLDAGGGLTVRGSGTLTLPTVNTYAGGTTIETGARVLVSGTKTEAGSPLGANVAGNVITLQGGTLDLDSLATPSGGYVPGLAESFVQGFGGMNTEVAGTFHAVTPGVKLGQVFNESGWGPGRPPESVADTSWGYQEIWIYRGQFYDADGHFSFAENIDDAVWMRLDGQVILNNGNWDLPTTGGDSGGAGWGMGPAGDGWHDIEIRLFNGGGGAGPVTALGWVATKGFGLNADGTTSTNGADYLVPADPGDMTVFRTPAVNRSDMSFSNDVTMTADSTLRLGRQLTNVTMGALTVLGGQLTLDTSGGSPARVAFGGAALTGSAAFNTAAGVEMNLADAIGNAIVGMAKYGQGTLTLDGTCTYGGPTVLASGTLQVNGSLLSQVSIGYNALLRGTGTVGGVTWYGGGAFDAGESPMTVRGAVNFSNPVASFIVNLPAGYSTNATRQWVLMNVAGGIAGFNPAQFTVNGVAPGGTATVSASATQLLVTYRAEGALDISLDGIVHTNDTSDVRVNLGGGSGTVVLEVSPNLLTRPWTPVATQAISGAAMMHDPAATNAAGFYRARLQ